MLDAIDVESHHATDLSGEYYTKTLLYLTHPVYGVSEEAAHYVTLSSESLGIRMPSISFQAP